MTENCFIHACVLQSGKLTAKALGALKRISKPSGPCVKKLAELYPTSKALPIKRLGEAFDPLQECTALSAMKKKKSSRVKPVSVEVVIVPRLHPLILPKGKKRQQLVHDGRVKTLQLKRTMSSLQLRNAILVGFQHICLQSWQFLEVSGGKLLRCDDQNPSGEIIQRRGAIYLMEEVCVLPFKFDYYILHPFLSLH